MKTTGIAALSAVIAIVLAGCGKSTPTIQVASRDSSGVTILDHPAGALAAVPQYRLGQPILSMGGANADLMHDAAAMRSAVFVDPDHFVVIDGRLNRLQLYDSTGAVQAIFGGTHGADSLGSPGQIHVNPDGTFWLVDLPARLFRLGANLQPTSTVHVGPKEPIQSSVLFVAGDTALAVASPFIAPKAVDAAIHRSTQYLVRLRPDGIDTLASWPGTEWFALSSGQGREKSITTQPVRFGRTTIVRPWDDDIVVGTGDGWVLQLRDSVGALQKEIVLHESPRPVTEALRDSVTANDLRQIEGLRGADDQMKALAREAVNDQRFADSVAPYEDAFAGRRGTFWVAETTLPTDSLRNYAIFGADGHLTGRLQVPASVRVLAADSMRVLTRRVSADGSTFVDLAPLLPARK
jgi:hypothetical protein